MKHNMSIPVCATPGCNNMCPMIPRNGDTYCELCCYKLAYKELQKRIVELEREIENLQEQNKNLKVK